MIYIEITDECQNYFKILFSFLLDINAEFTTHTTVYVLKWKSAVLKCQVHYNGNFFWEGPDGENDSVLYTSMLEINPKFSSKLKIVGNILNGEYNMQINNVTEKEEGIYVCANFKNSTLHTTVVTLIMQGKIL